jgi:thiol-disulfide isomerase/thioredoxin
VEPLAKRSLKLAEAYPDTPAGLAALCWAVSNAPLTEVGKKALAILKDSRIARAELDELGDALGLGSADWRNTHSMTSEMKQALAPLVLERVKQNLDQPRAAQLLTWVCTSFMDADSPAPHRIFAEAADLIANRFADSPDINHLCEVLGVIRNPRWAAQYERHLRAILKANHHSHVRLEARFALASILQGRDAEAEAKKEYEQFVKECDERARLLSQSRKSPHPDPWEGFFKDLATQAKNELAGMLVRGLGESPEIEGEDLEGRPMKLSDFRGKVVLVSFWATWCGPCMKFVPHERSLSERLKDKPFAIVGVNGDTPKELAKALRKTPVPWRSFKDKGTGKKAITEDWKILAWPTLYLVDHQGIIRKRWIGAPPNEELDREIEKLVQEVQRQ